VEITRDDLKRKYGGGEGELEKMISLAQARA
jgi:hypothetical protein